MDHPIIKQLNWRYATKRYDSSKKIDTKSIEIIKEAIRLAPSSYGLQPIKVIIVENEKLRQQIKTFSFNQQAITEASHLFILCAETAVNASTIDKYMQMTSEIREIPLDQLMGYSNFLKTILENQTASQKLQWAQKQAYIALGILVDACANLQIDATPIEGFEAEKIDELLNLKEKQLTSTLLVPVGYRHLEDSTQFWKKVRKSEGELFEVI